MKRVQSQDTELKDILLSSGQQEQQQSNPIQEGNNNSHNNNSLDGTLLEEKEYDLSSAKVKKLSLAFMLLFCAYGSSQNLISSLYKSLDYTNLGVISLFAVYFFFAFGSLISKALIAGRSYQLVFTLSNLGYSLYIASGIWVFLCTDSPEAATCSVEVIYSLVIVSASICGISASTLWVAQGAYVDQLSTACPSRRGILFGTFYSFMAASTIIGSILATALINFFGNTAYFVINTLISLISAYMMMFVVPNPESMSLHSQQLNSAPPISVDLLKSKILEVFALFKDPKAKNMLPFYCLSGIVVVFYSSFLQILVKLSLNPEEISMTTQYLSYVVIFIGISGIISGVVCGKLADMFNGYVVAILANMICSFGIFTSLLGIYVHSFSLCFIIACIWGSCDSFNASLMMILGSKEFNGKIEIFSLQKFVTSLSCAIGFIISILLYDFPAYYFLFFIFALQVISVISIAILLSRKDLSI